MGAGGFGRSLEEQTQAEVIRVCYCYNLTVAKASVALDEEKSLKELYGSVKSAQILERKASLATT